MNDSVLINAQAEWLDAQSCDWVMTVFRAEGVLANPNARSHSQVALGWTLNLVAKHYKATQLNFVCWIGGEPNDLARQVQPHIHALMEYPSGCPTRDELEDYTRDVWKKCLARKHQRPIKCDVLMRDYRRGTHEEIRYFERFEGHSFSQGNEKLLTHPLRLRCASN